MSDSLPDPVDLNVSFELDGSWLALMTFSAGRQSHTVHGGMDYDWHPSNLQDWLIGIIRGFDICSMDVCGEGPLDTLEALSVSDRNVRLMISTWLYWSDIRRPNNSYRQEGPGFVAIGNNVVWRDRSIQRLPWPEPYKDNEEEVFLDQTVSKLALIEQCYNRILMRLLPKPDDQIAAWLERQRTLDP